MGCNSITLNGINSFCETSIGGIVEVYGIPGEYISAATTADSQTFADGVTGVGISSFTYSDSAYTDSSWVLYKFRKNSSSLNKSYAYDDATGYAAYESELTMLFTRMDAAKRAELVALAKGGAKFIAKDANGHYWYLGMDEDVVVDQLTGQSGQQKTDGNYYQVVVKDTSKELPMEVAKSKGDAIAAAVDA